MQEITSQAVIALMTDFGLGDGDVGVMKGVMLAIAPAVHLIDLTHDVAPQKCPLRCWILGASYRYFPGELSLPALSILVWVAPAAPSRCTRVSGFSLALTMVYFPLSWPRCLCTRPLP